MNYFIFYLLILFLLQEKKVSHTCTGRNMNNFSFYKFRKNNRKRKKLFQLNFIPWSSKKWKRKSVFCLENVLNKIHLQLNANSTRTFYSSELEEENCFDAYPQLTEKWNFYLIYNKYQIQPSVNNDERIKLLNIWIYIHFVQFQLTPVQKKTRNAIH